MQANAVGGCWRPIRVTALLPLPIAMLLEVPEALGDIEVPFEVYDTKAVLETAQAASLRLKGGMSRHAVSRLRLLPQKSLLTFEHQGQSCRGCCGLPSCSSRAGICAVRARSSVDPVPKPHVGFVSACLEGHYPPSSFLARNPVGPRHLGMIWA